MKPRTARGRAGGRTSPTRIWKKYRPKSVDCERL